MSADRDILEGAAQLLADSEVGIHRPDDEPYEDGDTAIVFGIMPESPDRCIVLNWVSLTDDPAIPMGSGMIQAALRGNKNDALDISDLSSDVYRVFHGATALVWGSVYVDQILRRSSVPMGQDENQRLERADHYDLDVEYPPTLARPADA